MFVFQNASFAMASKPNSEATGLSGFAPEVAAKLDAVLSNSNARISVVTKTGTIEVAKKDAGKMANERLQALSSSRTPYELLKENAGIDESKLLQMIQSKIPWATEKSLDELKSGGSEVFRAAFNQISGELEFRKDLLRAELITSNKENKGPNLNAIGLDALVSDMATSFVLAALAISTVASVPSRNEFTVKAAGNLESLVGFSIDPKYLGHICSEVKSSYLASVCVSFDIASEMYKDTPLEKATQIVVNTGTTGSEKRAMDLMGKEFVDNVNKMIETAVRQFISARGAGSQEAFSAFIVNQLQMTGAINDMKEASEFAHNAAEKEQKSREGRNGFLG